MASRDFWALGHKSSHLWLYACALILGLLGALSFGLLLGSCLLLLCQLLAILIYLWNALSLPGLPLCMHVLQQALSSSTLITVSCPVIP